MSKIIDVMLGRTGPHSASKPGHTHITDMAADDRLRIARALAWSGKTGRPVPPHLRPRDRQLGDTAPLSLAQRRERYAIQRYGPDRALWPKEFPLPRRGAQVRRCVSKARHASAKLARQKG